ncbi:MAG: Flp family type IVb pilin [Alphaproteobacteria bacterium]|nr:MAG: Flp family type IVb pilin [Alphaproteobacteria bacterium]
MLKARDFMAGLVRDVTGATAIEYALIAGGIAVAIIAAVAALGGSLDGFFNTISAMF